MTVSSSAMGSMSRTVSGGLLLALFTACRSSAPSAEAPASSASPAACASAAPPAAGPGATAPAWDGEGDFQLTVTDFHFELGGTQVFAVAADGKVRDLFVKHELVKTSALCADAGAEWRDTCASLKKQNEAQVGVTHWKLAEYTLTPEVQASLRRALVSANMGGLAPRYANSKIPDGTTRTYRLVTKRGATKVSAYSVGGPAEPPALLPLVELVRAQQAAHEDARGKAREASAAERRALEGLAAE